MMIWTMRFRFRNKLGYRDGAIAMFDGSRIQGAWTVCKASARLITLGLAGLALVGPMATLQVEAGEADVIAAEAIQSSDGTWRISATIQHADEGWDHYADGFEILDPDGNALGFRVLHHPHVNEQPFTRSISGIAIPENVDHIFVRARDSVHGIDGGAKVRVDLP